jgi:hypothetical protein
VSGSIQLYTYNFSTVETKLLNYLYGVLKNNTQTENESDEKLEVYNTVKTIINSITADNKSTSINELSVHLKNIDVMEIAMDFLFEKVLLL